MNSLRSSVLAASIVLTLASGTFAAPLFSITNAAPPGSFESFATGMNNQGDVIGIYFTSVEAAMRGYVLRHDGTFTDLTISATEGVTPTAINDLGQITLRITGNAGTSAAIYQNGIRTDIGNLGSTFINPKAISNQKVVVGDVTLKANGDNLSRAFKYEGGQLYNLGGLSPVFESHATGVNDAGNVIGNARNDIGQFIGFIHAGNGPISAADNIGALDPDVPSTYPTAINRFGVVTGYSLVNYDIEQGYHGFIWTPNSVNGLHGTMFDIGTIPGYHGVYPTAINASGWVVGLTTEEAGGGGFYPKPFLFHDGVMSDINSLIAPDQPGWVVKRVLGVNDNGQIVAYGTTPDSNGANVAMLLSVVVPEFPSGILFPTAAALGIAVMRLKRRR